MPTRLRTSSRLNLNPNCRACCSRFSSNSSSFQTGMYNSSANRSPLSFVTCLYLSRSGDELTINLHRQFTVTIGGRSSIRAIRSEEHTSELQSLMRISYAVFCLKKKKKHNTAQLARTEH